MFLKVSSTFTVICKERPHDGIQFFCQWWNTTPPVPQINLFGDSHKITVCFTTELPKDVPLNLARLGPGKELRLRGLLKS